jgi:hypothetical protein
MPRDQIQMAAGREMTCVWFEPPIGLDPEDCVQVFQHAKDTSNVGRFARVDYMDIECVHGSAVQDCG